VTRIGGWVGGWVGEWVGGWPEALGGGGQTGGPDSLHLRRRGGCGVWLLCSRHGSPSWRLGSEGSLGSPCNKELQGRCRGSRGERQAAGCPLCLLSHAGRHEGSSHRLFA
jgi:hypothetical protein